MLTFYLSALDTPEEQAKMAEIYNAHKPVMLRYALKIVENKEIAEDAVHNAFLSIIKQKDKIFSLPGRDLRNLLVIITKNKCIDIIRQRSVFVDEPIDDMENALLAEDTPIEEQIILSEDYEAIKKHIAALDEASRLVLEMKYILGMSYKEIGDRLGITPKHVDTRIQRAKAKVRKQIGRRGDHIGD